MTICNDVTCEYCPKDCDDRKATMNLYTASLVLIGKLNTEGVKVMKKTINKIPQRKTCPSRPFEHSFGECLLSDCVAYKHNRSGGFCKKYKMPLIKYWYWFDEDGREIHE